VEANEEMLAIATTKNRLDIRDLSISTNNAATMPAANVRYGWKNQAFSIPVSFEITPNGMKVPTG
jgi:hypothetical protein